MTATVWLAGLAVLLFGPAGPLLARSAWPRRAPRAAVALWQSLGIAGALAAIGFGLSVAVLPTHAGLVGGVAHLLHQARAGRPLQGLGLSAALGLSLATDVLIVLVLGLLTTAVRTRSDRSRHRHLLDLVGRSVDGATDIRILDDPRVAAYCLPGLRPRIVLSAGALCLLGDAGLPAVVAHERGHARGRHGVVLLPFASMDALLRWLPYVRHARTEVAALLEMAADDFALRTVDRARLAGAIIDMAAAGAGPTCALGAATTAVARRIDRLVAPDRTSPLVAGLAVLAAAVVVVVPAVALL